MPLVGSVPPPPPPRRASKASSAPVKLADKKPAPTTDASIKAKRVATLDGYSQILQAGFLMVGWHADAETLDMHGGPLLSAVADLGDHHDQFGATLDKADVMGPYLALAVASIPLVMQFAANHGRIDATKVSIGGIVPPEQLANRRQAKLMKAQAEMIRKEREAQEEAMRAQESLRQEIDAFNSMRQGQTVNG